MARIRTIKPEFFTSDTVSALPLRARLTWIGLWTHCDDHGRCRDNVKLVKAGVWPLDDVSLRDIESDIKDLEHAGVLFRYAVGNKSYLQVTGWAEHQKVDRPSKSTIPAPPNDSAPAAEVPRGGAAEPRGTDTREGLASAREPASNPRDRKGKERKGREGDARAPARREPTNAATRPDPPPRESQPPTRCPEHLNDTRPPKCGQCADARRAHDQWRADRDLRHDQAPKCPEHVGELATNCRVCASVRKGGPEDP